QLAYSPDGSIYTCDEGRMFEDFKVGTVDQDLSKILTNNTVKGMVVASSGFANICDNCALKPFCGSCPLESYKQAGDIVSKLPLDRRCKIHGKMIEFLLQRASEDPKVEKLLKAWAKPPEK
ncbi:MAG: SPASM domain-containing protein, partial [Candidatus Altiarchaeota archaeon]|nr:SPASM domain-containing protein [Candidatus Altiarchaeota archaeon]